MRPHRLITLLGLLAAGITPLAAQVKDLSRPRLDAQADTNDPSAYYQAGLRWLSARPADAVRAFHWAAQLAPRSAEALYAQAIACLLISSDVVDGYLGRDRKTLRRVEVRSADSLIARAYFLNPFVHRSLDETLISEFLTDEAEASLRRSGDGAVGRGEIEYWVREYLARPESSQFSAWMDYSRGQFNDAIRTYTRLVKRDSRNPFTRWNRALAWVEAGKPDSALADLRAALAEFRTRDFKDQLHAYESNALLEFSVGLLQQALGDTVEARASYERSLLDDLAYYPAHLQLAELALASYDTAGALTEYQRAVLSREEEPAPRVAHARLLALAGKTDSALTVLAPVLAKAPWDPLPWQLAAGIADVARHQTEARKYYREYLVRAARRDPMRPRIEARLAALEAQAPQ